MTIEQSQLELERIASLCAELDLTTEPDALLRSNGLERPQWDAMREQLLEAMAEEMDRGDATRADRFAVAYAFRRDELLGEATVKTLTVETPTGATPAAPSRSIESEGTRVPTPQLASFQLASPPAAPAAFDADATAQVDNRKVIEALKSRGIPFDDKAPIVVPPSTPITHEQSGATLLADARDVHAALRARGIAIGGEPTSPAPSATVAAPNPVDPETTAPPNTRAIADAIRSRAVPFDENAPVVPPPPGPIAAQSGETLVADARAIHAALAARGIPIGPPSASATANPPAGSSLPLGPQTSQLAPASPPRPAQPLMAAPAIAGAPGETTEIDATKLSAALSARGIPFGREATSAPPPTARPSQPMPVERFAQIQAALTRSRDRDGVLAYFQVPPAQWAAVVQQMGAAMAASPALRAQYEELLRKALQHGR
ncbi:MAG: hypothetical protein HOW73_32135 [Polyangiaceae bacterium]|nr:hypothetical protein [Polyangiaceae bacterium]